VILLAFVSVLLVRENRANGRMSMRL
jgi:hypothetical protein